MGYRTEPVAVRIAHVLQKLHLFQFFIFFFIIHTSYRKKHFTHLAQKQNYTTRRFFCTRLTFFTNWAEVVNGAGWD